MSEKKIKKTIENEYEFEGSGELLNNTGLPSKQGILYTIGDLAFQMIPIWILCVIRLCDEVKFSTFDITGNVFIIFIVTASSNIYNRICKGNDVKYTGNKFIDFLMILFLCLTSVIYGIQLLGEKDVERKFLKTHDQVFVFGALLVILISFVIILTENNNKGKNGDIGDEDINNRDA